MADEGGEGGQCRIESSIICVTLDDCAAWIIYEEEGRERNEIEGKTKRSRGQRRRCDANGVEQGPEFISRDE